MNKLSAAKNAGVLFTELVRNFVSLVTKAQMWLTVVKAKNSEA